MFRIQHIEILKSKNTTEEELIEESADLLFHLLVLLGHNNIALSEVVEVLAEREGVSGLLEKSKRGD